MFHLFFVPLPYIFAGKAERVCKNGIEVDENGNKPNIESHGKMERRWCTPTHFLQSDTDLTVKKSSIKIDIDSCHRSKYQPYLFFSSNIAMNNHSPASYHFPFYFPMLIFLFLYSSSHTRVSNTPFRPYIKLRLTNGHQAEGTLPERLSCQAVPNGNQTMFGR